MPQTLAGRVEHADLPSKCLDQRLHVLWAIYHYTCMCVGHGASSVQHSAEGHSCVRLPPHGRGIQVPACLTVQSGIQGAGKNFLKRHLYHDRRERRVPQNPSDPRR